MAEPTPGDSNSPDSSSTQAKREMRIATPLGTDAVLLTEWSGYEAISELFCFQATLICDPKQPLDFDKLLGQNVTITLEQGNQTTRCFNGMVRQLGQGRRDDSYLHYDAEIVPQLWLTTQNLQSRIFQQMSVPDILRQVLADYNVSYELSGTYEPRNYCVQYRESDFDFVNRLMEEEGIYYFFQHSSSAHQLIIVDNMLSLPTIGSSSTIIYDELQGGLRDESRITRWEKKQQLCASKVTLWDHCFELPGQNLEASAGLKQSVQVGKINHSLNKAPQPQEIYEYPGGYAKRFDGVGPGATDQSSDLSNIFQENSRTANTRIQQAGAQALLCHGDSTCIAFSAGHQFTLDRHFNGDGKYLLTRVEHAARLPAGYRSGEDAEGLEYLNSFTCTPWDLPYRTARRTARPTINGAQTAVVVGPQGQQTFCDKYGRIKVQFHWDRQGQLNAQSSCWLRVGQLWAGNRWGGFFWPRIGQEVIVEFLEGDPDRPLVVGCVYNAQNMPPFEMPMNALINGIKSCTHTGDAGSNFNGVVFYDGKGKEYVQVHSERHDKHNCENSRRVQIGKSHTHIVGAFSMPGSGSGGGEELAEESHSHPPLGQQSFPPIEPPPAAARAISRKSIQRPHFLPPKAHDPTRQLSPGALRLLAELQKNRDDQAETIGSGRGGDDHGDESDGEEEAPFSWKGTDVFGGWAKNLDLTVGQKVDSVLGISTEFTFGAKTDTTINPLGFLGQLGGGESPAALGISGAFGGSVDFVIGSETYLVYGPHIDIHHGAKVEYNHGITLTLIPALAVAALEVTTVIVSALMPNDCDDIIAEFVGMGIVGIATALLIGFESKLGLAAMAEEAAEHVEATAKVAELTEDVSLLQPAVATAGVLVNDVATMATSMQRSLSDRIAIVEGRHVISGQSVALRASPPEGTVGIPFASVIATSPAQEGVVMLSADSMATMRGGLAYVSCSNVLELGNIMVNCSAGGVITLQQGILPVAPRIVLNDLGIKLSVGTASISLNAETGISLMFGEFTIKINEAGIQMSVAENSADISEAGITLSAADSTIEMTPAMISADSGATGWDISAAGFALDGPTIDLGCDAMYSLECAVLMESVDGAVERTAGIAMVE